VRRFGVEPLEGVELRDRRATDLAGRDDRPDAFDHGVEAPVVGDAEPHAVRRAGRHHPVALGHVERHRLFAEDVLARLGGGD
jgi:hypothetical protein